MVTADLTERINEALDGTTPGPWPVDYVHAAVRHIVRNCYSVESDTNPDFSWDYKDKNDPALIAAAPALLREAAEQLAAKDAELERLRARIVVWIADDGHPELYEAEIDTDLTDGAS